MAKKILILVLASFLFASVTFSDESTLVADTEQSENTFITSIQEALEAEEKSISSIEKELFETKTVSGSLLMELSAYRLQFSTYSNLLLLPETSVKSLEKANADHLVTLDRIKTWKKSLLTRQKRIDILLSTTVEQKKFNEKQFNTLSGNDQKNTDNLLDGYRQLLNKLSHKEQILTELKAENETFISNLTGVQSDFEILTDKFDRLIETGKRKHLFQRNTFHQSITRTNISKDVNRLISELSSIVSIRFWKNEFALLKKSGIFFLASVLILYGLILFLFYRIKRFVKQISEKDIYKKFWIESALNIFLRTTYLTATVIFIFLFTQARTLHSKNPLVLMGLYLLATWLFTRWLIYFVSIVRLKQKEENLSDLFRRIRHFIRFLTVFAIICIIGNWLFTPQNILFSAGRLLFLIIVYGWLIGIWRLYEIYQRETESTEQVNLKQSVIVNVVKYGIYGIIAVGIIAELIGFGAFAFFWMISWGRTSVVIMWAILLFMSAGEFASIHDSAEEKLKEDDKTTISIRWFLSRIGLILLVFAVFIAVVFSWGGKQAVLLNAFRIIEKPLHIGSWKISILSFILVFVAIFITSAIAKTWRHFFHETVLKESGIDPGVQESVSMLSFYLIWFAGILFSLNLLGVSMKTVTVVFGALGIGLGFGLQAIFNNFISGIILLFERPIQVGDDLEIDGVWATVKKINVRSTVVQTYDNATLIIPNSEFISAKVTNWSFKDRRIRRRIEVGVAYGSDVELVRKTLLEAADITSRILKLPKPDVIFTSFGDNSLIFVLRIWTRVDYFISVETEARVTIDRLFRERNIEISFPQRDIHIRTIEPETPCLTTKKPKTTPKAMEK